MRRCLILVEGQTEETFVREILRDHLQAYSLWVTPILINTRIVKDGPNFKGGVRSYGQIKQDLLRLCRDTDALIITTLLDYYGLPKDFPGFDEARAFRSARERVEHLEHHFRRDIADARFLPHLVLHEFEAWLFSDLEASGRVLAGGNLSSLVEARSSVASPEEIDDGPKTAPSKRILTCYPGYSKPLDGPLAVLEIGLPRIRAECPHFAGWLSQLEALGKG